MDFYGIAFGFSLPLMNNFFANRFHKTGAYPGFIILMNNFFVFNRFQNNPSRTDAQNFHGVKLRLVFTDISNGNWTSEDVKTFFWSSPILSVETGHLRM